MTTREMAMRHRRSFRLRGYDYTQAGAYFVTICVKAMSCLFGDVVDGEMRLNEAGRIAKDAWMDLPNHYTRVAFDTFVVMPNHVHGIIALVDVDVTVGAGLKPAPTKHGIPEIVRGFKTFSARRINRIRGNPGVPVWQRNYFEHIVRNEIELNRIREYIVNNPAQWETDHDCPDVGAGFKPAPTWNVNS